MNPDTEIIRRLALGERLALATIVSRSGSAPRQAGTHMAVFADTTVSGSIGGGQVESKVLAACRTVLSGGSPRLLHFDMSGFSPAADIICGGTLAVLVECLTPGQLPLFNEAAQCRASAAPGVWVVDITDPSHPCRALHAGVSLTPGMLEQIRRNTAAVLPSAGQTLYIEPILRQGTVLLCGGGHVSLATARLAHGVGFDIIVTDDRPEFASPDRFPFASVHLLPGFQPLADVCAIGPAHYVVIATRGHSHDLRCLSQALRTPARYIGMIGSRRKRDGIYASLREAGFSEADFRRVHSPIGLAIGAESPEEIAVSIVAELIAARKGMI